jgi:cob(I)alamin adenosyltransferase
MKIYTRTGDTGESSLLSGRRIEKNDPRLHAYGDVDELNALLGLLASPSPASPLDAESTATLERIQNQLFNLGSQLACDDEKLRARLPAIAEKDVEHLEREIDRMEVGLPPLKNFILPGGCRAAAQAHVARTVARRAERRIVELNTLNRQEPILIRYINRLSDYLFVLARHLNQNAGVLDRPWSK